MNVTNSMASDSPQQQLQVVYLIKCSDMRETFICFFTSFLANLMALFWVDAYNIVLLID
jgi:hypothetical protein